MPRAHGSAVAAPWIGVVYDWQREQCTVDTPVVGTAHTSCGDVTEKNRGLDLSHGVGAGIDLFDSGPHRFGLAAAVMRARDEYTSVGLSIAYRYW